MGHVDRGKRVVAQNSDFLACVRARKRASREERRQRTLQPS